MGKQIAIEMILVAAIGFILGLIGPFGTYAMGLVPRLGYWITFGVLGYAIFRPLIVTGDWLAHYLNIPKFFGVGIAMLIASVPMTVLVAAFMFRMDIVAALQWKGLAQLYAQVFLIGLLCFGFSHLVFGIQKNADENIDTVSTAAIVSAFESRLPQGFGPILALRSEDHYVRAIGEAREVLILTRLRDAIAELRNVDGMQVHRSWWVARSAIASTRRDGRQVWLCLKNGQDVAVARETVPKLRAAGWLS